MLQWWERHPCRHEGAAGHSGRFLGKITNPPECTRGATNRNKDSVTPGGVEEAEDYTFQQLLPGLLKSHEAVSMQHSGWTKP